MNAERVEPGQAPIGKFLVKMSVPATFAMLNRLFDRVHKTLKLTLVYASANISVGFLLLFLMPRVFAGIFTTDPVLIDTAVFLLIGIPVIGKPFPRLFGLSGLLVSFPIAPPE